MIIIFLLSIYFAICLFWILLLYRLILFTIACFLFCCALFTPCRKIFFTLLPPLSHLVIPAKAGILGAKTDPRLRGDDKMGCGDKNEDCKQRISINKGTKMRECCQIKNATQKISLNQSKISD